MSTSNYSRFSETQKSSGNFPRLNPSPSGLRSSQFRKLNVSATTTQSGSYALPPVVNSAKPVIRLNRLDQWK